MATTLNIALSVDTKYSSHLTQSTDAVVDFDAGKNKMTVVRTRITEDIWSYITKLADKYDRINIMLTEGFNINTVSLLNVISNKIVMLIVAQSNEWTELRKEFQFCPQGLMVVNGSYINLERFSALV